MSNKEPNTTEKTPETPARPTAHAEFAPSSLARLEKCPGSYAMAKGIPGVETEFSARGTMLHEEIAVLARAMARGEQMPEDPRPEIAACLAYLRSAMRPDDRSLETERRVSYSTFSGELYFGTADVVITRADGEVLLIDWKFGNSIVAAPGNLQLAAYAVALAQERGAQRISAAIFQPVVSEEPAVWEAIDVEEQADRILAVIEAAKAEGAPVCPGDHCRFCPAWQDASCAAIRTQSLAVAKVAASEEPDFRQAIATASDERIARWMDQIIAVRRFCDAVEEETKARARKSGNCANWRVATSAGRLTVKDTVNALARAREELHISEPDLLACCSLSQTKLVAAAKAAAATKEARKEAEAAAKAICEECGERGAAVERLVRKEG